MPASESHHEKVIRAPTLEALEAMAVMMEEAGWRRVGRVDASWQMEAEEPICWVQKLQRPGDAPDDQRPMDAT